MRFEASMGRALLQATVRETSPALLPNHLEKIEDRTRVNGGNSVKWRRREKMQPGRERCRTANNGKART